MLGIGVTWHSRMSNASKGCHEISRVLSSYAEPGRRCVNAMWQYQIGCLHSCDIHHSVFSPKKGPSVTPSKHMDQGGFEPAEGGGPSCEWFTSARNLWCDRSLPLPKDCPQYIPKGKPTPASKLAFVTSCGCSCKIVSKGSCSSCSCSCSCLRDVIVVVVL